MRSCAERKQQPDRQNNSNCKVNLFGKHDYIELSHYEFQPKTTKMPEPPFRHLLDILWRRECGFYDPYPQRSCAAMLRSIYKDAGNNIFDCIYTESSSKHIYIIENRVYFDNLSVCKTFYGHDKPQLQYRQAISQSVGHSKIADFTPINAVGLERSPVPKAEYRNVFYVLNQSSVLSEQDLLTGERLREVYLADYRLCKFKSVSFCDELNRIYIESVFNPQKTSNSEVIYSVVVFQFLPLKLIGRVEFTKTHFGKGNHPGGMLKEIGFQNDILITYHGPSGEKLRAYIYDFNQILSSSNKLYDVQLDKHCFPYSGLIGHRPTGIPVNYHIRNLPPALYFIDRSVESIMFSPLPLLHIVGREKGVYEVYDTASQKLVEKLGTELSPVEEWNYDMDDYFVSMDYRDRVVYKNAEKIRVYSVERHYSDDQKNLVLDFEVKLPEENDDEELEDNAKANDGNLPKRVMPARLSKTNLTHTTNKLQFDSSAKIVAFNYFGPLELFVMLANIPSYANTISVLLYDAIDGQLMLQFHTSLFVTNNYLEYYYDIHLYYDFLYILQKAENGQKYKIFTFQLQRDVEPIYVD